MDRVSVAYRDHDRTPLLYVIREMAALHESLDVEFLHVPDGSAYERGFLGGDFDLICEHLRFLFPARLAGHPVRCLASCQNWSPDRLLARAGITSVNELRGSTVAIRATESSRLTALHWLRHLGLDGSIRTIIVDDREIGRWQQWRKVADGEADAVICSPLYEDAALASGLHALDVNPLPEIGSLFFAALGPFVARYDGVLRRFMRALYRAVFAFHHDPQTVLKIMAGAPARLLGLHDPISIERRYETLRAALDERPIPRLEALQTTFAMLNEAYAPLAGMNPLSLWDLRYMLELEEEQFMDGLVRAAVRE
jgi:ABC-type nitrate/sulfonate/bicarbonate transport system substrate-binding protein